MKLYLLPLLLLGALTGRAQAKDHNRSSQVEQLQQVRQSVTRKIDSLQVQLYELAVIIESTNRKIDHLKKEAANHERAEKESKEQPVTASNELSNACLQADSLRKKFDARTAMLDKTLNLQKDLEEKIATLAKESSNR